MTAALILTGAVPLELISVPPTREALLGKLGISGVRPHTKIVRHRTGLVATGLDEGRRPIGEVDLFVIARAEGGPKIRVLNLEVPAPALLVAQKSGGSDFAEWLGYREVTDFVPVREDLAEVLRQGEALEQVGEPDARFNLFQLESVCRELGKLAPAQPGVLRLVALDPAGNVAASGNYLPTDWLGMRNFSLRAFDARQTCHVEGVLRAVPADGSTAETPAIVEYIKWDARTTPSTSPRSRSVRVTVDGEVIAHGALLSKPAPWKKGAPVRVPIAGLPVFRADGESRPVVWSSAS